jgi:hypothetical protein
MGIFISKSEVFLIYILFFNSKWFKTVKKFRPNQTVFHIISTISG